MESLFKIITHNVCQLTVDHSHADNYMRNEVGGKQTCLALEAGAKGSAMLLPM